VAHVTNDMINADGVLKLKIRVMCCIGSFRQFHFNHFNNDHKSPLIKHKECNGINLRFIFHLNGTFLKTMLYESNVRVIGKVTAKTREIIQNQFNLEEEDTGSIKILSPNLTNVKSCYPAIDLSEKCNQPFKKFCQEIKSLKIPPRDSELDHDPDKSLIRPYKKYCLEFKSLNNKIHDKEMNGKSKGLILPRIFRGSESYINLLNPLIPPDISEDPSGDTFMDFKPQTNYYNYPISPIHSKPPNWTILELLNTLTTARKYDTIKYCITYYRNKIDSIWPIAFRQIFEDKFFNSILQVKEDSIAPLYLINFMYLLYLCKENNWIDSKTMYRLSLLSERIYNHLSLLMDYTQVSWDDYICMADGFTRAAILQVMHRNNFRSAQYLWDKAYFIYQKLGTQDPGILQTAPYEILMWHRSYMNLDETVLQEALTWAFSYETCHIKDYIIFLKILTLIYPQFYSFCKSYWKEDIDLELPSEDQKYSLLKLCHLFPKSSELLKLAVESLKQWISSDLGSTWTSIENITTRLFNNDKNIDPLKNLLEPLPVQIVLWVAIQLYARIVSQNLWMDRIALRTNIQLISHFLRDYIVRGWSVPLYMLNYTIFTKYSS